LSNAVDLSEQAMTILRLTTYASLLVLAAPALAAGGNPKPPVPLANPGEWVSSSDYPSAALRSQLEGVSKFILTIDPNGIVVNCLISVSSGSSELDAATCRLITDRARFEPARNNRGKPITGSWANSVRWQIPRDEDEYRQLQSGMSIRSFLVLADGIVSDCRVEASEGASAKREAIGPTSCGNQKIPNPYTDANGQPVSKRVRITMKVEIVDELPVSPPTAPTP
jgi:periplasmic protein TonB